MTVSESLTPMCQYGPCFLSAVTPSSFPYSKNKRDQCISLFLLFHALLHFIIITTVIILPLIPTTPSAKRNMHFLCYFSEMSCFRCLKEEKER